jgi:DNA-binding response OmpR family regulator
MFFDQSPIDGPSTQVKPTVLVVEDDTTAANAMSLLLEHYAYHVKPARTVGDALAALSEQNPSIILLDLMLPDGNGISVLAEVRQRNLPARVLVITGASDPQMLRKVERLAPEAVLQKPVDFLSLLARMRRPGPGESTATALAS